MWGKVFWATGVCVDVMAAQGHYSEGRRARGLSWERGESEKGLLSGEVLSGIMENMGFEPRRTLAAWSLMTLRPHLINM